MSSRVLKARCRAQDKTKLRTREAAEWWGRHLTAYKITHRQIIPPPLFTYQCKRCGYWHITSHPDQGGTRRSFPIPDQFPESETV